MSPLFSDPRFSVPLFPVPRFPSPLRVITRLSDAVISVFAPQEEEKMEMKVPCCPDLEVGQPSEVRDFHYRQIYDTTEIVGGRPVQVEVTIRTRLERASGKLALGDLAYTTTLMPGEDVHLFTADRRSRFTFDKETSVSYRVEQTLEEQFYMSSMQDFMSDLTVKDEGRATNKTQGSLQGHGDAPSALESLFGGSSVDISGSFNAESTSDFLNELTAHAQASHHASVSATHAVNAVSVGSVGIRDHASGQSQDQFEATYRHFSNPNRCHAITFYFYRIDKVQTVTYTLEAIDRRVIDPAAETRVTNKPFVSNGRISVIPNGVLATAESRPQTSTRARSSSLREIAPRAVKAAAAVPVVTPLSADVRKRALQSVNQQLMDAGLLTSDGKVATEARNRFNFTRRSTLPTPGLFVRGCLDECDICEPSLLHSLELDSMQKGLIPSLLMKQQEILGKLMPPSLATIAEGVQKVGQLLKMLAEMGAGLPGMGPGTPPTP